VISGTIGVEFTSYPDKNKTGKGERRWCLRLRSRSLSCDNGLPLPQACVNLCTNR
ncbi:unnamed protein product, partial [Coregonus sp. 'balchen']